MGIVEIVWHRHEFPGRYSDKFRVGPRMRGPKHALALRNPAAGSLDDPNALQSRDVRKAYSRNACSLVDIGIVHAGSCHPN
jgi:hypothetical protein